MWCGTRGRAAARADSDSRPRVRGRKGSCTSTVATERAAEHVRPAPARKRGRVRRAARRPVRR